MDEDFIADDLGMMDITKAPKDLIFKGLMGDAIATLNISDNIIDKFIEELNIWILEEDRAFNEIILHQKKEYKKLIMAVMFELVKKKCEMADISVKEMLNYAVKEGMYAGD